MKAAMNKKKRVRADLPWDVLFGLRFFTAYLILWLISDIISALPALAAWILVICRVLMLAGVFLLLRKRKKLGLYLIISGGLAGLAMNLALGFALPPVLIGSAVLPLAVFWLVRKNPGHFE